jgi:hypothetical protein
MIPHSRKRRFTNGKDSNNGMVCIALDETKIDIAGISNLWFVGKRLEQEKNCY